MSQPRVSVDAMGGDHGPAAAVEGALLASRELGIQAALVGPRDQVTAELQRLGADASVEVVDAPEVVAMGEKVSASALRKRSSIHVAAELVREGHADAFFSAGNTAACWTIAKRVLGTLPEVDRPALAAVVPNRKGRTTVLLDVGANAQCKARHLEEFAVMGSAYARGVLHVERPRVGLMSVGEEQTKGNETVREAHEALRASGLEFAGNVEGHDVFSGDVDVVVMDGFTGNVVLKTCETLAEFVIELVREEVEKDARGRLGEWLLMPALREARRRSDPAEIGGAPLLGVRGCCVIGHGRSGAQAVRNGIRAAAEFHTSGVNAAIAAEARALGTAREAAGA
ncbi:MAG: phosphate acyltransferase PlsX [Vicinamibacteria bacterium]